MCHSSQSVQYSAIFTIFGTVFEAFCDCSVIFFCDSVVGFCGFVTSSLSVENPALVLLVK